ncbi:UNVERIFIED_CONTAM: hypothetical protein K2H54_035551 [Gekko kuhli]
MGKTSAPELLQGSTKRLNHPLELHTPAVAAPTNESSGMLSAGIAGNWGTLHMPATPPRYVSPQSRCRSPPSARKALVFHAECPTLSLYSDAPAKPNCIPILTLQPLTCIKIKVMVKVHNVPCKTDVNTRSALSIISTSTFQCLEPFDLILKEFQLPTEVSDRLHLDLSSEDPPQPETGEEVRVFQPGDMVCAQNYSEGLAWVAATVSKATRPVSYEVATPEGQDLWHHLDQPWHRWPERVPMAGSNPTATTPEATRAPDVQETVSQQVPDDPMTQLSEPSSTSRTQRRDSHGASSLTAGHTGL